ncbi:MAG: transcriptional regulator, AraC family protein [Bacteroidetes bacterium]|nr:transcriptional regulator, AraC family protein [Bacteroidota bacterium]
MRTEIHVGIFDAFIFLGVFQGFLLSWFFIKSVQNTRKANLYQGLLLLALSLCIFEEWLNNTGYIVKVLALSNFSEPLNFALAPLFYLYIRSSLNPEERRKDWVHFILTLFWMFYMIFYFIQPEEFKYNSYIETKHPDWGYLRVLPIISDDPLGIRAYCNQVTAIQFLTYMIAGILLLLKRFRSLNQSLIKTDNELLIILRNTTIHIFLMILFFLATKLYFGMRSDIGGYIVASYVSFMIFATSYQVLNRSDFFNEQGSFLYFPISKYQKSSLSEEHKASILTKIKNEMERNRYFTNNLASLSGLSKQINESSHHVSQVINERLNKNFFELLAFYRVEYAKKLIKGDREIKLTVEELAEMVGYNSKSSFNIAFKKHTLITPSEYRKSLNNQ